MIPVIAVLVGIALICAVAAVPAVSGKMPLWVSGPPHRDRRGHRTLVDGHPMIGDLLKLSAAAVFLLGLSLVFLLGLRWLP